MNEQPSSKEQLSEAVEWLIAAVSDSSPYEGQMLMRAAMAIPQQQQEIERLQGIRPELPPRPPEGEALPRYGIRWNGPDEPLAVPMVDGYWTPWHLAARAGHKQATASREWVEIVTRIRAHAAGIYNFNAFRSSALQDIADEIEQLLSSVPDNEPPAAPDDLATRACQLLSKIILMAHSASPSQMEVVLVEIHKACVKFMDDDACVTELRQQRTAQSPSTAPLISSGEDRSPQEPPGSKTVTAGEAGVSTPAALPTFERFANKVRQIAPGKFADYLIKDPNGEWVAWDDVSPFLRPVPPPPAATDDLATRACQLLSNIMLMAHSASPSQMEAVLVAIHKACVKFMDDDASRRAGQQSPEVQRDAERLHVYFKYANAITHPSLLYSSHEPFEAWRREIDEYERERAAVSGPTKPAVRHVAQHEETGRMWWGPKDQIPKGYADLGIDDQDDVPTSGQSDG